MLRAPSRVRGPGPRRNSRTAGAACRCATAYKPAGREARRRLSLVFVLATDEGQRAALPACRLDMVQQRVLASMRDPDLLGAGLGDGLGQFSPVGMVGDD